MNINEITHRVKRLVNTPTILTVPKYAALKGVVVIMVLSVMDTQLTPEKTVRSLKLLILDILSFLSRNPLIRS